jgi:hypothetical protein
MAVSAEQLNIILSARDKEFAKAMERSQKRVEMFAKRSQKDLSKTGAAFSKLGKAVGPLIAALSAKAAVGAIQNVVQSLDDIGKTADQIGITTDALQELRTVAESAGVSQSALDASIEKLGKGLAEASMGIGTAKTALEQLNLSADGLMALGLDGAMAKIADEINKVPNPMERTALAMQLFGRSGAPMLNLLREGSDGMAKMREDARALGVVVDEDLIRSAEDAQTQLDLMSRVISAQLASALIDLAPLLVGSATAVASFVKNIVVAIDAMREFINPTTDLEIATDNLVTAMGDEIRQSQQLDIALGRSSNVSVQVAKQKLKEATARHENAQAALAEQRAIALGSDAYSSVLDQIKVTQDAARGLSAAPETLVSASKIEAYEQLEQRLVSLREEQARMLSSDQALADQSDKTAENIKRLELALSNAKGGMVSFGDEIIEPVEATDRLSGSISRVKDETAGMIESLSQASPVMQSLGVASSDLNSIMSTVESSMENAFMGMVDGTMSAKDAFKSMASSIIKELFRVLVVQRLVNSISGAIFGGGGGGAPAASIRPMARPMASGGSVQSGQPYVTGEHGRELFVPSQNGRILSVAQSQNAARGGGGGDGVTVIQNNTFGGGVTRAEINSMLPKMVEATKAAVADSKLRGGSYGGAFS